ncbi:MAG: RNA methyltransferase [Gemmatimonadota bacterium]|nr:RNA methyltransferase [Gemmatimonadota bacterium]MDE2872135.1 RNA methyltransferase [Gemmatimonadota bacterium]
MNITVVLHEPRDLVNIAAAVRAMANMGLERLTLVDPAEFDPWRITGIAHRTDHIVEAATLAGSLEEALADATCVVGTSARPRTAQRNYRRPRELAPRMLRRARRGRVAIVFGREDRGLSNDALDLCHEVMVIPTAPGYASLNLAQAVLLVAYELLMAGPDAHEALPAGKRSLGAATSAELEEMYQALEAGLDRAAFFRARKPESVMRILRTVFGRTALDAHEARMIRSIGYQVRNRLERAEGSGPRPATEDPPQPSG